MMHGGLGWRRQLPDPRDRIYAAPPPITTAFPVRADLRHSGFSFPCYDQGQTSSCTGHGVGGLMQYAMAKEGLIKPGDTISRLFPYYNGRMIEGTQDVDQGANIRDVIKSVAQYGICMDADWPFDPARVNDKPPDAAYQAARRDIALDYRVVPQTINQMRACLAEGFPFTFGFLVYPEFDGPDILQTGRLAMPGANDTMEGGHCVAAWGYDDDASGQRVFLCRNSWGSWGPFGGYFLMPYEFILDPQLCSDFWTIRAVGST